MLGTSETILLIAGMALASGLPRILPLTLLADKNLPFLIERWLTYIPAAILAALVAPEIFLINGSLALNLDNIFLLASLPTLFIAWKFKSLFLTLASGMGLVALIRFIQ